MSNSRIVKSTEATDVRLSVTLPPMADKVETVAPSVKGAKVITGGVVSAWTLIVVVPTLDKRSVAVALI